MTNHYRNFYRLAIVLLNILILFLFLIDIIQLVLLTKINDLKLMWDCIGFAVTVFLDISQQNVLNQIGRKPVAMTVITVALGLAIVIIILSIF